MRTHHANRFKPQIGCLLALTLFATRAALAATPVAITFKGDSTLHGFGGTVEGRMVDEMRPDGTSALAVVVPVVEMHTGHDGRDRKMYAMFESGKYVSITGWIPSADLDKADTETPVTLHLAIHGREQDIPASMSRVPAEEGQERMRLEFDVSLKQYELSAPSVIGLIRVSDTVHVVAEWPEKPVAEGDVQ